MVPVQLLLVLLLALELVEDVCGGGSPLEAVAAARAYFPCRVDFISSNSSSAFSAIRPFLNALIAALYEVK